MKGMKRLEWEHHLHHLHHLELKKEHEKMKHIAAS
jgi:hypothetical protein